MRDTQLSDWEAERTVSRLLDRLAVAVHSTPEPTYGDIPEGRAVEYDECRRLAAKRFPDLGFYDIVDVGGDPPGDAETMVGDAIDDLADIYGELCDVEALFAAGEPGSAVAAFGSTFVSHWGRHLRELQLFLHVRHREGRLS